jgi:phosphoserine phosphatase RsbU/P
VGLRWDGGAVWKKDRGGLAPIARWPDTAGSVALTMTDGMMLGLGEGLPGHVAASGAAAWIETVSTETIFIRQERAESAGVRSCFAFPVQVGGDVLGVVEMYSRARQAPEPELLAVLETAGREIGRYLERTEARRHLVELAEALQASLLPPHSPTVPGLDVAVRYRAAGGEGQIGGDFFDVFPLPDGEWAILIGDVSGRGPRAAALTALARYTLRAAAMGATSPSVVLAVLNDVVRRELETAYHGDERFVTVAYLTLSPSATGFTIVAACGGHPQPLARRADGSIESVPCQGDLIGAFDVHESRDRSIELGGDDLLVLVTDGVIEARGEHGEFGEDRLRQVIAAAGSTAAEVADAIEAAVLAHLGGHPQDDLAIVVLRLPATAGFATSIEMRVPEGESTA